MQFWRSIAGMVQVELTSASPERFLERTISEGIEISSLEKMSDLTCRFQIKRKEYGKLTVLCQKNGERLKILRRAGLYWKFLQILKRPVLAAGMLLIALLALYLPSRIYFVRVEGNETVPARKILSAAEDCGIVFGASRRRVRSEKTKNALLSAIPQLQWAGVNTSGCVATISVRERTEAVQAEDSKFIQSIVAIRDGYVLSATVTEGTGLVIPGQSVQKGQILISGYTDCGICIRAEGAAGEVMAQTSRELEAVMPAKYDQRTQNREVRKHYSLLIGKKRIKLWKDSGICSTSCGRMYEEYYITLPGGFKLPIAFCVDSHTCWETVAVQMPPEETASSLSAFAEQYLKSIMLSGNILRREQTVTSDGMTVRMKGVYRCTEMIGMARQEQIGDTNGKNS